MKNVSSRFKQSYKRYLLGFTIFICIYFGIKIYPTIEVVLPEKLECCKDIGYNRNNKIMINNISSFVNYLNITSWINRECYFVRRKRKHCTIINIHSFLMNSTDLKDDIDDKYTILINSWRRNECLMKCIEYYLKCKDVAQIRVIWSDPYNDIPLYFKNISNKLIFDEYKDNKLTNRFKYNDKFITNGLFQTDDDILFSCDLISNTHKLWRLIPNHLIGFAPRETINIYKQKNTEIVKPRNQTFYEWLYSYEICKYSLLFPTLGSFLHKKYYQIYDNLEKYKKKYKRWKEIKDSINGNVTAEDISMSLLYSYISGGYIPITVVIPQSKVLINHLNIKQCQQQLSVEMHNNSQQKRTNIFLDILDFFDYYNNFNLTSSNLWVDVMPPSQEMCYTS